MFLLASKNVLKMTRVPIALLGIPYYKVSTSQNKFLPTFLKMILRSEEKHFWGVYTASLVYGYFKNFPLQYSVTIISLKTGHNPNC